MACVSVCEVYFYVYISAMLPH